MNREIKGIIIEKLRELPVYIPSDDDREHTVRCPYCGDSLNPNHAHLGLRIDVEEDTPMIYNCFRCGASGIVTDELLEDLNVFITEAELSQLRNYNRKVEKLGGKRTIIKTERFRVAMPQDTCSNRLKLDYINWRIGISMTLEDMPKLKIVPSLYEFMVHNEIKSIDHVKKWVPDVLERGYVGFLSTNNNLITFRKIDDNQKGWRYYKLFLNPYNSNNASFYSIPSQLDLFYQGELHIHIAEGTFDIASIKMNLNPQYDNQIFYAACGYSYMAILKHLARSGIIGHTTVHVYADKDKTDDDHMKMLRSPVMKLTEHCILHRNAKPDEKDYGVSLDRIDDSQRRLW